MANPFLWLIDTILWLYMLAIIVVVIMSWLLGFGVINSSNPYVRQVGLGLRRLTEPVLGPVRRALPDLGPMDISPLVVLLAIVFLRMLIPWLYFRAFLMN